MRGLPSPAASRDVIASHPKPLIEPGRNRIVNLKHSCDGAAPVTTPCDPVAVQVPSRFPWRSYSEFIFGVASSSERLRNSIPQFEHWLANTGARLLAIVTDEQFSRRQMKALTAEFNQASIRFIGARPVDLSVGVNEQHFLAVGHLLRHADAGTKWGVVIDDDTFFPSLFPLAQTLDKLDASLPAYVGGLSENSDAVKFHGHMAYGGGGIFLSVPLMKLLEPYMEACLNESRIREGDGMLKYCVDEKTATNLTMVNGLHQLDFGGDLSGFYESGKLPLSLHHWKTWHHAPVDKIAKVAHFCGGCLLQRWRFGADTILSNGYSIAVYNQGIETLQLHRMETTWGGDASSWEWSLGPMREKISEDRKKSYRLIDAEIVGDNLRQVYVHRAKDAVGSDGSHANTPKDEVVELWWDWQ
jgi:hypothetical protein